MGKLIAVAGKGGTGKTTCASLLIRHLVKNGKTPILAVDADPNYTLGDGLGIEVEETIGMMREKFFGERAQIPAGMTKEAYMETLLHRSLHESKGFDLLTMGRQEGPGCYCYLNNILRRFMDVLSGDYPFTVVDNEAGMEHLSRRNTRHIDALLVVLNHSVKAARAARRIKILTEELNLDVRATYLILNQISEKVSDEVTHEIEASGLELLGKIPVDRELMIADQENRPLLSLPDSALAVQGLDSAFKKLLARL